MEGLFDHVHAATERVLRANGYQILEAPGQGCCGALHAHAGQHETAIALARNNLEAFADSPNASIAINSAGCGAMLKEYGRLLGDDSAAKALADRVRDVSELLSARGPVEGGLLDIRVAYDPPCHLLHAQRIADPPRVVLDAIPGLEHVPHATP
jgi:glycolate oxidase iron-sulfur subunit